MTEEKTKESKTLFSKVVHKKLDNGAITQSHTIEAKEFDGTQFIQITQDKMPFGNQPAKRSWITLDPKNNELKSAIIDAFKSVASK